MGLKNSQGLYKYVTLQKMFLYKDILPPTLYNMLKTSRSYITIHVHVSFLQKYVVYDMIIKTSPYIVLCEQCVNMLSTRTILNRGIKPKDFGSRLFRPANSPYV